MNARKYREHITEVRYLLAVCQDCGAQFDSGLHNKEAFAIKLAQEGWIIHSYRLLCDKCGKKWSKPKWI